MKEASGELSMTAVAVVAIAAVGVVFTTLIWPNMKRNITSSANCSQAFRCDPANGAKTQTCYYMDDSNALQSVMCPIKD